MADSASTTGKDNSPEKPVAQKRSLWDIVNLGYLSVAGGTILNAGHGVKRDFYKNHWYSPEHTKAREDRARALVEADTTNKGSGFSWKELYKKLKKTREVENEYYKAVDNKVFGKHAKTGVLSLFQKLGELEPHQRMNLGVQLGTVLFVGLGAVATISLEEHRWRKRAEHEREAAEQRHETAAARQRS